MILRFVCWWWELLFLPRSKPTVNALYFLYSKFYEECMSTQQQFLIADIILNVTYKEVKYWVDC